MGKMFKSVYITTDTASDKLCSFLIDFAGIQICSNLPIDSLLEPEGGGGKDCGKEHEFF